MFKDVTLVTHHGQYWVWDGDDKLINNGRRPVDKAFYLNVLRTLEREPTSVYYKGDKVSS
jgi:hypothetical protein